MVFEPGFKMWVEFGLAKMGVEKRCFRERKQTEPKHKGMKILDWVLWIDYGSILFKWNIQRWEQLERWMGTCLFLVGFTWTYSGGRGVVHVWEWCGENSPWGSCCVWNGLERSREAAGQQLRFICIWMVQPIGYQGLTVGEGRELRRRGEKSGNPQPISYGSWREEHIWHWDFTPWCCIGWRWLE